MVPWFFFTLLKLWFNSIFIFISISCICLFVDEKLTGQASFFLLNMKIFSSKEEGKEEGEKTKSKGDQAKELLAKYGGAYLATSITLSLISFSLCYALISAGVDVQALLQKVKITCPWKHKLDVG